MRINKAVACLALAIAGFLAFGTGASAHAPFGDAMVTNGTVMLGIHQYGHLNVPGGPPSSGTGTTFVGLRFVPTGAEATAPGCLCEGWGAADATSGVSGYANEAIDGVVNLTPISFTTTASTAVSVVDVGTTLRVTHDYHPSLATPNLYQVDVTIENISGATVSPRYRRVMDWDVEPTAFSEFVTAENGSPPASELITNNNDGFATANPLGSTTSGIVFPVLTGDFTDAGPNDHGALFDFGFAPLAPGEKREFKTYYGAAANEAGAFAALAAVGAPVFSLGQPSSAGGPDTGVPNTFIFAFGGVGENTLTLDPPTGSNPIGSPHTVTATLKDGAGNPLSGQTILFNVTGSNTASGSGTTDSNGQTTFTYTGTNTGQDTIAACHDNNTNASCDAGEATGTATKDWTDVGANTVTVDPPTGSNPVGTPHTVTATLKDGAGNPLAGESILFQVSGANTASGSGITDSSGQMTFTYTGTYTGQDTITACHNDNGDSACGSGEAAGTATKDWTEAPPADTCNGKTATIVVDPSGDGTAGNDLIVGTPGDDVIIDLEGNNKVRAKGGSDTICTGPGNDEISGGGGHDWVDGGDGRNSVEGNDGRDTLETGSGNDELEGNGGNDTMTGGDGADKFQGGGGTDTVTDFDATEGDRKTGVEVF